MRQLIQKATTARANDRIDEALAAYQQVLRYDPQHSEALRGIRLIAREQRERIELDEARTALGKGDAATARQLLGTILAENPGIGRPARCCSRSRRNPCAPRWCCPRSINRCRSRSR